MHVALHLERQGIVNDAMDEIDKMGEPPEHCGKGVVVTAEHKNLAPQQIFICLADIPDAYVVRH